MSRMLAAISLALLSSACVVTTNGVDDDPDMNFRITFEGQGCDSAHVDTVRITFVNPVRDAVTFPCQGDFPLQVGVADVVPGSYRVTLEGLDGDSTAYGATFDIVHTLEGSHLNPVDLPATTEVLVNLQFAGATNVPGLTCAEAGVSQVVFKAGTLEWAAQPCVNAGRDAVLLAGIQPGTYDFEVNGLGADGTTLYSGLVPSQPVNRGANEFTFDVPGAVNGTLEFSWQFAGSATCGEVFSLEYELRDATGKLIGSNPEVVACSDGKESIANLAAGRYSLLKISAKNFQGSVLSTLTSQNMFLPAGQTKGWLLSFE